MNLEQKYKRENDERIFKLITLANQMKVLIISDRSSSTTEFAEVVASVDPSIGSLGIDDPKIAETIQRLGTYRPGNQAVSSVAKKVAEIPNSPPVSTAISPSQRNNSAHSSLSPDMPFQIDHKKHPTITQRENSFGSTSSSVQGMNTTALSTIKYKTHRHSSGGVGGVGGGGGGLGGGHAVGSSRQRFLSHSFDSGHLSPSHTHGIDNNKYAPIDVDVANSLDPDAIRRQRRAACAVSVNIGSFSDPEEYQGLAHFMEHMLFMGSKRFPGENSFDQFINSNGGESNAHTEAEQTLYYFSCAQDAFAEGMERFADFFVSPMLGEGSQDREIAVIDSEFNECKGDLAYQMDAVRSMTSKPKSPFSYFACGNSKSLGSDSEGINSALRAFFHNFYTASNMTAVVYSTESILVLEELVQDTLGRLQAKPPKGAPPPPAPKFDPKVWGLPYQFLPASSLSSSGAAMSTTTTTTSSSSSPRNLLNENNHHIPGQDGFSLGCIFRLEPKTNESHRLHFTWQLPPQNKSYRTKPFYYLACTLGNQSPGSVIHSAKELGLATSIHVLEPQLSSTDLNNNSACTLFEIAFVLTDYGIISWRKIVSLVYQYIGMLRMKGIQKWKFDELAHGKRAEYIFNDQPSPSKVVQSLAPIVNANLSMVEHKDILYADDLLLEWDEKAIREVLDHLKPQNMRIDMVSKFFMPGFKLEKEAQRNLGKTLSKRILKFCAEYAKTSKEFKFFEPNFEVHFSAEVISAEFMSALDRAYSGTREVPAVSISMNNHHHPSTSTTTTQNQSSIGHVDFDPYLPERNDYFCDDYTVKKATLVGLKDVASNGSIVMGPILSFSVFTKPSTGRNKGKQSVSSNSSSISSATSSTAITSLRSGSVISQIGSSIPAGSQKVGKAGASPILGATLLISPIHFTTANPNTLHVFRDPKALVPRRAKVTGYDSQSHAILCVYEGDFERRWHTLPGMGDLVKAAAANKLRHELEKSDRAQAKVQTMASKGNGTTLSGNGQETNNNNNSNAAASTSSSSSSLNENSKKPRWEPTLDSGLFNFKVVAWPKGFGPKKIIAEEEKKISQRKVSNISAASSVYGNNNNNNNNKLGGGDGTHDAAALKAITDDPMKPPEEPDLELDEAFELRRPSDADDEDDDDYEDADGWGPLDAPTMLPLSDDLLTLWHLQDGKFKSAKCHLRIKITSARVTKSPLGSALADLLIMILESACRNDIYLASISGTQCTMQVVEDYFVFSFTGFEKSVFLLMERILGKVFSIVKDGISDLLNSSAGFGPIHDSLISCYKNNVAPLRETLNDLLRQDAYSVHTKLVFAELANKSVLQDFSVGALGCCRIEGFVYGNVTVKDGAKFASKIRSLLEDTGIKPFSTSNAPEMRGLNLQANNAIASAMKSQISGVAQKEAHGYSLTGPVTVFESVGPSTTVLLYFQIGKDNAETRLLSDTLVQLLSEPLFATLRTRWQVAYVVLCSSHILCGIRGICIEVSSHTYDALSLINLVDDFLKSFEDILLTIEDEFLNQNMRSLAMQKLEKDSSPSTVAERHWTAILARRYVENSGDSARRREKYQKKMRTLVAQGEEITPEPFRADEERHRWNIGYVDISEMFELVSRESLCEFFAQYISPLSCRRKRMSVLFLGEREVAEVGTEMIMRAISRLPCTQLVSSMTKLHDQRFTGVQEAVLRSKILCSLPKSPLRTIFPGRSRTISVLSDSPERVAASRANAATNGEEQNVQERKAWVSSLRSRRGIENSNSVGCIIM